MSRDILNIGGEPIFDDRIVKIEIHTYNPYANVPLNTLLGFYEDFKRIVINARHELILILARNDNNCVVVHESTEPKITLLKIQWRMPHVVLNDVNKLSLLRTLKGGRYLSVCFRSWNLYEFPQLQSTTKHSWAVKTTSQLEKPRYRTTNVKKNTLYLLYDIYVKFQKTYYGYNTRTPMLSIREFLVHGPFQAISLFQEYYQIQGDGTLNNYTLYQMRKPRCGLPDIYECNIGRRKWAKTHLTWNFQLADPQTLQTTEFAFSLWAANSSLSFERKTVNPDILIYYRSGTHTYTDRRRNEEICVSSLDGPGGVLAHAFYPPTVDNYSTEIHIDSAEPWHIQGVRKVWKRSNIEKYTSDQKSENIGIQCFQNSYLLTSNMTPHPHPLWVKERISLKF
ncbi:Matrix metalloproteinase-14 [Trachymyrmex cornetzi]|uniref:Matrix metalloproteinase-14 n=1 Tax=Trachymyrmex cornetzi TaxID=471704 RepID=A0A151JPJ3_9HYME|nr:Matrix metalloproteinase-14 [Trachymyrmex cornetzi]